MPELIGAVSRSAGGFSPLCQDVAPDFYHAGHTFDCFSMNDLQLPFFTSHWTTLIVFLVALAAFHLVLICWWKLGKVGWKVVDYFWLAAALLGVFGTVSVGRQAIAANLLAQETGRLDSAAALVRSAIRFGSSPEMCRKYGLSASSELAEGRLQRAIDEQCEWFANAERRLDASPLAARGYLQMTDLGSTPSETGIDSAVTQLRESIDHYNNGVREVTRLKEAQQNSEVEEMFVFLGPLLLAVALALRIAKVTGEIRLERRSAGSVVEGAGN